MIGCSATVAPASSGSRSTRRVWPFSTRYCLPPVLTIAYMGVLSLRGWLPPWQRNGAVRLCGHGAEASILRHRPRTSPPTTPPATRRRAHPPLRPPAPVPRASRRPPPPPPPPPSRSPPS